MLAQLGLTSSYQPPEVIQAMSWFWGNKKAEHFLKSDNGNSKKKHRKEVYRRFNPALHPPRR